MSDTKNWVYYDDIRLPADVAEKVREMAKENGIEEAELITNLVVYGYVFVTESQAAKEKGLDEILSALDPLRGHVVIIDDTWD